MYLHLKFGLSPQNTAVSFSWGGWGYSVLFKEPMGFQLTLLGKKFYAKAKEFNYIFNHSSVEFALFLGSVYGTTLKNVCAHLEEGYKHSMVHGECLFGPYCTNSFAFVLTVNGIDFNKSGLKLKKIVEVCFII